MADRNHLETATRLGTGLRYLRHDQRLQLATITIVVKVVCLISILALLETVGVSAQRAISWIGIDSIEK